MDRAERGLPIPYQTVTQFLVCCLIPYGRKKMEVEQKGYHQAWNVLLLVVDIFMKAKASRDEWCEL